MAKQNEDAPVQVASWLDSSRGVIVGLDSADTVADTTEAAPAE